MNQCGKSLRTRKARHGKFIGRESATDIRARISAAHKATSGDVRAK